MNITYVAKPNKKNKYERYKIFNFENKEQNPFFNLVPEGESINIDMLADFLAQTSITKKPPLRSVRFFLLDAIIDGYTDIRYYYS